MAMRNGMNSMRGITLERSGMIGRAEEYAAIVHVAHQVVNEQSPQVVTIIGNPGAGKSRLVTEVLAGLAHELPDLRVFGGVCRPESGIQSALARILRSRLALSDGSDAMTQAAQMRARVT